MKTMRGWIWLGVIAIFGLLSGCATEIKGTVIQKPEKPISKLTVVMNVAGHFSNSEIDYVYSHVFAPAWARRIPEVFGKNGLPVKAMILNKGGMGTPSPDPDNPTEGFLIISPKSTNFKRMEGLKPFITEISYTVSFKLVSRDKGTPVLWTGEATYYANQDFQSMLKWTDNQAIHILESLRALNLATVAPGPLTAK